MRTLIDIQDDLLADLLKEAQTSVKKDAIVLAIKTFLDVRRREKLSDLIGNYDFGYSLKELEEMRKERFGKDYQSSRFSFSERVSAPL
jgi:Arc/MetJ family transcription regulator